MSGVYTDFRFNFPISGLATALQAMAALQASGLLGPGQLPANMLGTARDASGNPAVTDANGNSNAAWKGDPGTAATSYTDPNLGVVNVPARGDPTQYYIAIRAVAPAGGLPFDPSTYGLVVTDAATSAAVLGVWA